MQGAVFGPCQARDADGICQLFDSEPPAGANPNSPPPAKLRMCQRTGPILMFDLIAAGAYFLLIHFGVSGTRLRDTLVARLGEGPFRGAFALASVIGLV